ncbi:hypothetical protein K505DRAFT_416358 [Melanomma pulvis-pyrius CBS 109.77]|uniref:Uncharacterized protein n=1 Tax=Melanomma pulvis-pyrius CBS 109.77 TaxID=1314802 RepID=A0A6A6XGK3_9PLEO|nr:hypothetical protein K505DRAFT_416358 [Melanomma pulvis-pyrius CBS 109.77]
MTINRTTLFTSLLAALAIGTSPVSAAFPETFTGCTPLDHATFYASKPAGINPVLGPAGLYYAHPDATSCAVLELGTPGFADAHPELHASFSSALDTVAAEAAELGISPFKEESPLLSRREVAAKPGCGQFHGLSIHRTGESDSLVFFKIASTKVDIRGHENVMKKEPKQMKWDFLLSTGRQSRDPI